LTHAAALVRHRAQRREPPHALHPRGLRAWLHHARACERGVLRDGRVLRCRRWTRSALERPGARHPLAAQARGDRRARRDLLGPGPRRARGGGKVIPGSREALERELLELVRALYPICRSIT